MGNLQNAQAVVRARLQPILSELKFYEGLDRLFERCFMNTLETTVRETEEDTFVITGDIHAMWLRDSSAQVLHYLRFADDPSVAALIEGLIRRQVKNILIDPYANAFNQAPSDYKPFDDRPRASDWVWERKYEIDSLCYPVWLAHRYHAATGSARFLTDDFMRALHTIADVFETEQNHAQSPYRFERVDCPPSDTLTHDGRGEPVAVTGMTFSGFRPSDDACQYGYLIPANLFAAQELEHIAYFAQMKGDDALRTKALNLSCETALGVERFGHIDCAPFGDIYAYETDGMGNYNLMDDANVPSLLALPYLGVCAADDPRYLRTRAFVLSERNPYYHVGRSARGVGSPHTPKGYIWHIGLCVQAMTALDTDEIADLLGAIVRTHAGCEYMHESFDPNDPAQFTREWFAWANSMFGEMLYRLYEAGKLKEVLHKALA